MKITVTRKHIFCGVVKSPSSCPIALAAKDAGISSPYVNGYLLDRIDHSRKYLLPAEAMAFLGRFDNGDDVAPFTFEAGEIK